MIWHSQMVTTVHPIPSRVAVFSASRSTFLANFASQNSRLCSGIFRLHRGQRCQKHPFTNIATFLPG